MAFFRKHRRALPWVAVGAAALGVIAFFVVRYLGSFEETDDAQIDGNVSTIASRIAGTVTEVHVEDNDRVGAGQLLVKLDPADYQVALEQAEANLQQVRFERVAQSKAHAQLAKLDLGRSERLLASGSVAQQDLDTHRATSDASGAEVLASKAAVGVANAGLDQARLNVSYTTIAAPVGGIVGQKEVNVGDRVQTAQALLAVVQVDDLWVTANYKETQLRRMQPGQRVDVHVDALGRSFRGHVENMPGASGARFSLLPPENATGNYVKVVQRLPVRIRLEPGQPYMDRLRPGMSVEPKVWLR
jgi:membrane fusion protein, multidrug efflux system